MLNVERLYNKSSDPRGKYTKFVPPPPFGRQLSHYHPRDACLALPLLVHYCPSPARRRGPGILPVHPRSSPRARPPRTIRHIGPERSYVQDQLRLSTNRVCPFSSDAELISFLISRNVTSAAAVGQQTVMAGSPAQSTGFTECLYKRHGRFLASL